MKIASITSDRKQIVKVLEEVTRKKACYLGSPTFGYEVGSYIVDRSGNIIVEKMDPKVKVALVGRGIIEDPQVDTSETTIFLPLKEFDGRSLRNLVYLFYSKGPLLGKAVGKPGLYRASESLMTELKKKPKITKEEFLQIVANGGEGAISGLSFANGKISFHFPYTRDVGDLQVFRQLTELMGKKAKEQSRVSPIRCKETNERYTFRGFLLRLGMTGDEYRMARQRLLQNLNGHSSFRTKDQAEAAKEKTIARRAAQKEAAKELAFIQL